MELLTSLVKQLVELVSDGEPAGFPAGPEPADPFEALVADLEVDPDEPEVSEDPVLKRLFPDAYPHDTTGLVGVPAVHRARPPGQEGG